jgi:amino acid transporter
MNIKTVLYYAHVFIAGITMILVVLTLLYSTVFAMAAMMSMALYAFGFVAVLIYLSVEIREDDRMTKIRRSQRY